MWARVECFACVNCTSIFTVSALIACHTGSRCSRRAIGIKFSVTEAAIDMYSGK